ncbi:MAG: hypothetical protein ACRC33_05280, partial [Gemmataceae bacterium]
MREIIETVEGCVARAAEYIGTHNATAEELAAIDRLRAARESGTTDEVLVALIAVGDLQRSPVGFWREVQRAANLVWLQHPMSAPTAQARERFHYLVGLRQRIEDLS